MKFTCKTAELNKGLGMVSRGLAKHPTLPVLEGFLVIADNDGLKFRANDLTTEIEVKMPAEVEEVGEAVLPRMLIDMVKVAPGDLVDIVTDGDNVNIKSGKMKLEFVTSDAGLYPGMEFPAQLEIIGNYNLSTEDIMAILRVCQTTDSGSSSIFGGVLWEDAGDEEVTIVGTDQYRLAMDKRKFNKQTEGRPIRSIIPANVIDNIGKLVKGAEGASIMVSPAMIRAEFNSCVITSRTIAGNYPDYRQVLPPIAETMIKADKNILLAVIERATIVANREIDKHKVGLLKLDINGGRIQVSAAASQVGTFVESVDAGITGPGGVIIVNSRYLMDQLRSARDETVSLEIAPNGASIVLREGEFVHLMLPVRIK